MNAVDMRWVRIRRPTIVVGGELTMDALEVAPGAGKNDKRWWALHWGDVVVVGIEQTV